MIASIATGLARSQPKAGIALDRLRPATGGQTATRGSSDGLIQINGGPVPRSTVPPMTRHDWTLRLSIAATLAVTVGAICILLFVM